MLIVKIWTTKEVETRVGSEVILEELDEIHIQDTDSTVDGTGKDWHIYQIKKPDMLDAILHKRKEGYLQLIRRVLKRINKYRMFPELKESRRLVVSYKEGRARVIWSTHQNNEEKRRKK